MAESRRVRVVRLDDARSASKRAPPCGKISLRVPQIPSMRGIERLQM
jgi:hypothetical protein